jgi:tight adherence protein C
VSSAVPAATLAACSAALGVLAIATWRAADRLSVPVRSSHQSPIATSLRRLGSSPLGRRLQARRPPSGGHVDASWNREVVGGVRLLGGLAAALLLLAPPPAPILAIPVVAMLVRLPAIVAARSERHRRRAASVELPLFLDLLAVATSAGLAPQLAVRRALEPTTGPLAFELGEAIRATDLGGRWRDELEAAGERLQVTELRRAVALLRRTERFGASLGDEMQRLAVDVRESRRSRAAERARAAPVKMLFPLVFLILPAFLLLTVVPVLLTTVRSIG